MLTFSSTRLCPKWNGSMPGGQDEDELTSLGSINAPVAASFFQQ
jgi:hypothetical protein